MKKFLSIMALYCSLVLIFVLIINAALMWISGSYKEQPAWAKFWDVPQNIDICNFGSSHGLNGFDYSNVQNQSCFNFSMSSQSLTYDYKIMQQYQDYLKEGCVVFITVTYRSLFGIPETETRQFESKNMRYYGFLHPKYIENYSLKNHVDALTAEYLPSASDPLEILSACFDAILNKSDESDVSTDDVDDETSANQVDIQAHAEAAVERHTVLEKYDEQGNLLVNQTHIDSLKAMIALCRQRNCRPVLIGTPFTEEYNTEIQKKSTAYVEKYRELLNQIVQDEQVEYYDYADDVRFSSNHELFQNSDHLNEMGAKLFVDILMEEVVDAQ